MKIEALAADIPRIARMLKEWPPEAVEQAADEAFAAWGIPEMRKEFGWSWNPRLRTTAGRAFLHEDRIELNPRLLARHPELIRAVVIHEFAHLVQQRSHPNETDHGPFWRALMRKAGLPPDATHDLPVDELRVRRRRGRRRRRFFLTG